MSSQDFRVVAGHHVPNSSSDGNPSPDSLRDLCQPETVCVSTGEVIALLMHAARTNRTWLSDFADETMQISQDMYEVLLHYKRLAQESNARAA